MSWKKWALVAAAILAVCGTAYYFRDDIQRATGPRATIVQGELVPPGRLRSAVGLTYGNERQPRCGGALIAPDMVLTAAHCLCGHTPEYAFIGENPFDPANPPKRLYYRLGRSIAKSSPCANLTAADMVDVAVIRIQGQVGVTPPFAFADAAAIDSAPEYLITGYGATDLGGTTTDFRKREAKVVSVSSRCKGTDEASFGCHQDQEIVAGRPGSADSCNGDSGSPLLVVRQVGGHEQHLLAGLVSRGIRNLPGCGQGGIYERMSTDTRAFIDGAMTKLRQ